MNIDNLFYRARNWIQAMTISPDKLEQATVTWLRALPAKRVPMGSFVQQFLDEEHRAGRLERGDHESLTRVMCNRANIDIVGDAVRIAVERRQAWGLAVWRSVFDRSVPSSEEQLRTMIQEARANGTLSAADAASIDYTVRSTARYPRPGSVYDFAALLTYGAPAVQSVRKPEAVALAAAKHHAKNNRGHIAEILLEGP
jgi:hypothetical protein